MFLTGKTQSNANQNANQKTLIHVKTGCLIYVIPGFILAISRLALQANLQTLSRVSIHIFVHGRSYMTG